MNLDKRNLEELISQKMTLGNYIFDEKENCFFGDAEIELYISKIEENKYQSELYYFDGYEIYIEDEQKMTFEGNFEIAKKQAIESFNSRKNKFMNFPIFYKNITCILYE